MARIYLTGASGYIGSALLPRLLAEGHEVERSSHRLPAPPSLPIHADIIIHLAAAGGGSHHLRRPGDADPDSLHQVNVAGLQNLLSALESPQTRVLYFSSNAVYGRHLPVKVATEIDAPQPDLPYALSKVAAEFCLRERAHDRMILRPCGIFGATQSSLFGSSFLNVATDHGLQHGAIDVFGGGQGIDTLYIDDLVELVCRICGGEWKSGETYNVAGDIVPIRTMMETLSQALNNSGHACLLRQQAWTPRPAVLLDNSKLRRDFRGWRPTPLADSLGRLVQARATLGQPPH